ncbi:hypothetical protein Ancab_001358 [Ancistrocladus abbreviatus]
MKYKKVEFAMDSNTVVGWVTNHNVPRAISLSLLRVMYEPLDRDCFLEPSAFRCHHNFVESLLGAVGVSVLSRFCGINFGPERSRNQSNTRL